MQLVIFAQEGKDPHPTEPTKDEAQAQGDDDTQAYDQEEWRMLL